jgi:hypothetical protein
VKSDDSSVKRYKRVSVLHFTKTELTLALAKELRWNAQLVELRAAGRCLAKQIQKGGGMIRRVRRKLEPPH